MPRSQKQTGEQQILALFEAGDQALMSADIAALSTIFANDYIQYNPAGQAKTRSSNYLYLDVLQKRNGEWKIVASQLARPSD